MVATLLGTTVALGSRAARCPALIAGSPERTTTGLPGATAGLTGPASGLPGPTTGLPGPASSPGVAGAPAAPRPVAAIAVFGHLVPFGRNSATEKDTAGIADLLTRSHLRDLFAQNMGHVGNACAPQFLGGHRS